MFVNTEEILSLSKANQNFSEVTRKVDKTGKVLILKNNTPKYLVVDINNPDYLLDLTEDERFEIVTKRILKKYLPAFKELAK